MLSNSLINAVIRTMSQSNFQPTSRKKVSKSSGASSRNSNHKLKRNLFSTTHVVDIAEEEQEDVESIPYNSGNDFQKDNIPNQRKVDKTVSSASFYEKKFFNGIPKSINAQISDIGVIKEESELLGLLTKQLYFADAHVKRLQLAWKKNEEQLKSRDQEISALKRKIKELETKNKDQETLRKKEQQQRRRQTDRAENLYKRCRMLENKIMEMEKFLADYDLMWVGDTNKSGHPEKVHINYIATCYEQIIANIDQLNLAAGKGEVHVHRNEKGSGASFKTPSCMSLKFYKNGMIVQGSPLRPYNDPATISFLKDILDGYFPSELQQAHPFGVPFKVEDHRTQVHVGDSSGFPGQGYRLGKQPPADNVPSTSSRKASNTSQRSGRRSPLPKDNSSFEFSAPLLPSTPRSVKSKSASDTPSTGFNILRSQILAMHNNICSDTHLQSHINAELGVSSRQEKRDLATRNSEYDPPMRGGSTKSRSPLRFGSSGRCYHSSTDRSSSRISSGRLDYSGDRARQRSRSASLGTRLSRNSRASSRTGIPETVGTDFSKCSNFSSGYSTPKNHCDRSTNQLTKNAPPLLHQINEPSGKEGELRLKVRSLNGGTIYLVHVSANESVARLYQLLDRIMTRSVPRGYKIVLNGYSPRRLEQLAMSLRDSGITRDSVLHLVND